MKTLTNNELIKVQGGAIVSVISFYLIKKVVKFVTKNLKLLTN